MTDDFSSDDSRNFLVFLQLLRSSLPGTILITAAVSPTPLTGSDGNPMKDLLSFAKYLNFVTLMVYDIFEGIDIFFWIELPMEIVLSHPSSSLSESWTQRSTLRCLWKCYATLW